MKVTVKDRIRHYLNPLHVYCSLAQILKREKAFKTAKKYEKTVYKTFLTSLL